MLQAMSEPIMDDLHRTALALGVQQRFKGYDRIMGNISWLLIALVVLATRIMPVQDHTSSVF